MAKHILLVDDDMLLRRSLAFNLEQAGYKVSTAAFGADALALARKSIPDLTILDIGLPDMDGLEVLKVMHRQNKSPIIFLTARRRELDQVLGLELGAEDYITKPFDLDVLLARIKVVLRRVDNISNAVNEDIPLTVGDLTIDRKAHKVTLAGKEIELPPRVFDLLYVLALDADSVIATDDLVARVWGAEFTGESQVLYVHIRWLREKIEDDPNHPTRVVSVRRLGYKLCSVGAG